MIEHFHYWFQSLENRFTSRRPINFPTISQFIHSMLTIILIPKFYFRFTNRTRSNGKKILCVFLLTSCTRPSYSNGLTRTVIKWAMISTFMREFHFVLFTTAETVKHIEANAVKTMHCDSTTVRGNRLEPTSGWLEWQSTSELYTYIDHCQSNVVFFLFRFFICQSILIH